MNANPYCRTLTRVMAVFFKFNLQTKYLKCLASPAPKIWPGRQNVELIWGYFGAVGGHLKSQAMSPFDRAHTTFYSTLI